MHTYTCRYIYHSVYYIYIYSYAYQTFMYHNFVSTPYVAIHLRHEPRPLSAVTAPALAPAPAVPTEATAPRCDMGAAT